MSAPSNRLHATVVLSLCLFISLFADTASAEPKVNSPAPFASEDPNSTYKSDLNKFRDDQKAFQFMMKSYEDKRRAINKAFKEVVDKAINDSRAGNSQNMTQLQKRLGGAAKQSAVMTATAVRDAAMDALGLPPVRPTSPAKPERGEKNKKPQPQNPGSPATN